MTSNQNRLISLITHDLRNGLNAISISMHMIEGGLPETLPELESDMQMLREGVSNLRRMLELLTAYAQFLETDWRPSAERFSTRRMLEDVANDLGLALSDRSRIRLEIEASCPAEVELDPRRAHEALCFALTNALTCDEDGSVVVRARGEGGRWLITIRDTSSLANPDEAEDLEADRIERLVSNRRERRGVDLAIVAGISRCFGGSARLASRAEGGAELILNWPTRLAAES
jgi:signal transduction histidine kinase